MERPPAPSTIWTPDQRHDHLRAMLADLATSPPRRQFKRTAKQQDWSPCAAAEEILARLDAGSAEHPDRRDQWEIKPLLPTEADIGKSEYFLIKLELRNTGAVPWKGRLLRRLGVGVTPMLPMTPRVLSVPTLNQAEAAWWWCRVGPRIWWAWPRFISS